MFDDLWSAEDHNTYNYVVKVDGFYGNFDPNNHEPNLQFLYYWK